jgi:threonine aldolase
MASMIDLRSDTVTLPPPGMLEAMARAPLGDDVFGEDPTCVALEARAAEISGKEAALFVPSGTMGNLIAVMAQAGPGDELICAAAMHTFAYEQGGAARLAGVSSCLVAQQRGCVDPAAIAAAIRPDDPHCPRTALVWIEQPFTGWIVPPGHVAAIAAVAHAHRLPLHMDGARIFNAAVALGVPVATLVREADTVMWCLSKGLAAPVGSVLTGPAAVIARARRLRKVLGGGMRQAGVLAAAGLYALDHMVDRLADDHRHARRLAEGLRRLGWQIDREACETNIFCAEPPPHLGTDDLGDRLEGLGVRILWPPRARSLRLVTHYGIEDAGIDRVLEAFASLDGS